MYRCEDCFQSFDSPKKYNSHVSRKKCIEFNLNDPLPDFCFKIKSSDIHEEIWNSIFMSYKKRDLASKRLKYVISNSDIDYFPAFFIFLRLNDDLHLKGRKFVIEQLDIYYQEISKILENNPNPPNKDNFLHIIKLYKVNKFEETKKAIKFNN